MLNDNISNRINLKEYIDFRYEESLSEVEFTDFDSEETKEKRKISYLTLNWFMQTLLDRSDRMAMYNGFELRVPFCDHRLARICLEYSLGMESLCWQRKRFAPLYMS